MLTECKVSSRLPGRLWGLKLRPLGGISPPCSNGLILDKYHQATQADFAWSLLCSPGKP